MNKPRAADLGAAAVKISTLLFDLQKQLFSQQVEGSALTENRGLLGTTAQPVLSPTFGQMDPRASTYAEIRAIPAVQWLTRQVCYMGIKRAFEKTARITPSSKFTDPDAIWRLASCTLSSLYLVEWYREHGVEPLEMSKEDWAEATDAIKVLVRLTKAKGLNVGKILLGDEPLRALPYGWEHDALARLEVARLSARKPCSDGKVAERRALKAFALALHREFGKAPALVVTEFGALIDYCPSSIKRNIPLWIEESSTVPTF